MMDSLPHSVLLQILSRLDESADVARCRVASKAFNTVYPGLRSINLRWRWYSWATINQRIRPFMPVFLNLISKLEIVESICISIEDKLSVSHVSYRMNEHFVMEWLSRVSGSLKSLSITDSNFQFPRNLLLLISESCPNLVNLELCHGWLESLDSLNPMPSVTSLTLGDLYLEDEHLNELNKCFPNLQFLKLVDVGGLIHPKIHFLNLKTYFWHDWFKELPSLTLITPNLITLTLECLNPPPIYIKAPMLSHFSFDAFSNADTFMVNKFENLKTLRLKAFHIGFLLSKFPVTKTVETLTLYSQNLPPRGYRDSEFTLGKVFSLFPNVTSLCINSDAWLELEAWLKRQSCKIVRGRKKPKTTICQCSRCLNSSAWLASKSRLNPQGQDIFYRSKGLKKICAHLKLVDPWLTFSVVALVLDQCVGLSIVSLLIRSDVTAPVSERFRSKCMARWPGLKWRWGIRSIYAEDSWITDGSSV